MAFGLPYKGSKNIYAKQICEALPFGKQLEISKVFQQIGPVIDAEKFAHRIIEAVQEFLDNR